MSLSKVDQKNSTVFKVSGEVALKDIKEYKDIDVQSRLKNIESFKSIKFEGTDSTKLLDHCNLPSDLSLNGFAEAIHIAYDQHHALTLAPHHLLLVVLQGLAIHINQNPVKYVEMLGIKDGAKENIDIRRDDFLLGKDNPWQELFPEFVSIIGTKVNPEFHQLLAKPFSTSDELAIAVTSLTIMDLYQSYFTFSVTTRCGIPEICLLGTHSDWEELLDRVKKIFDKFDDLEFWSKELIPVLEHFVKAKGTPDRIDKEFWTALYKPEGGSGGPFIRGWINAFYPYLQTEGGFEVNEYINWKDNNLAFAGLTYNQIPVGFSKVPFIWNYLSQQFKMMFVGGFLGVIKGLDENHVMPGISWAVCHQE